MPRPSKKAEIEQVHQKIREALRRIDDSLQALYAETIPFESLTVCERDAKGKVIKAHPMFVIGYSRGCIETAKRTLEDLL